MFIYNELQDSIEEQGVGWGIIHIVNSSGWTKCYLSWIFAVFKESGPLFATDLQKNRGGGGLFL